MGKLKHASKNSESPNAVEPGSSFGMHPSRDELYAMGKSLRDKCSRASHAEYKRAADRPDPIALLEASNKGRIPELIPIRYGRMMVSPFTWYRGTALNMAADLASTPTSGLRVQCCGDAHICNFGAYATPERRIIFDVNDLDETLPAPWEWDVKRLAASFVLACRDNGFREDVARDSVLACVRSYREHMAEYSKMKTLDVWYESIELEKAMESFTDEDVRRRAQKRIAKAQQRSVLEHDFPGLVHTTGLTPSIRENPPTIYHLRDASHDDIMNRVRKAFEAYRETLPEHRRVLLDRFKLMDVAIKVVGVGSVGTTCAILLLMASDKDPLFLQVKEARQSVLEPYAGKSVHENHGQRVVHGCQLMQSASDLFLGWTQGIAGRHFYVRQLKDIKIKMMVELFTPTVMQEAAGIIGCTLAHAHARSGEPAKISGYMGKGDTFDEAIADFSVAYADQSEKDHEVFMKAVKAGKLQVFIEPEQ